MFKVVMFTVLAGFSIAAVAAPPKSVIGIGQDSCANFVTTYDSKQLIDAGQEPDIKKIVGTLAAYADFNGTLGGFFAANMMHHGDKKLPFNGDSHAMSLAYAICKDNPDLRYIDVVWSMAESAFGRTAK